MKRRELLRQIQKRAAARAARWEFEREGGRHSVYRLDGKIVPIPRHNEIREGTAQAILRDVEAMLKEGRDV